MTNQADRAINIAIKEVELVEVGKEKHDETLAKIEAKADKAELDSLKNTVSENQTQLQEQLQSQDEKINTKLDESQVKALIAEAELDDLTLEQVQQEIIKQVADKASTQAVNDANQAQDAKIGEIEQSLADKASVSAVDELKEQLTAFVGSGTEDKPTNQRVDEIARSVETKADKEHAHSVGDITGLTETLASKADATHAHSLDDITGLNDKLSTLASSEAVNTLQEQVQSQSELISGKLDEEAVKALIAEAELDDLTLEQVQQEIITRVADKASTQAVAEANQAQDSRIEAKADASYVDNIKQSLENKDGEIERSLDSKANAVHTHSINDITGLNDRLSDLVSNETLQNSLADKATTQAVAELTTKIQKLSEQMREFDTRLAKQIKGEKVHQDAPDPASARAEEPVAVSDTVDEVIEGQDPEIKAIIDNLRLESYQEVMGNDGLQGTTFDKVQIKFNKEVKYNSWGSYIDHATFAKDDRGYYTAKNVNGGVALAGIFNDVYAEGRDDTSVQVVEVVFTNGGVRYVKKFDLIPDDDTDRKVRHHVAY